jgi:replicative DNA helicase
MTREEAREKIKYSISCGDYLEKAKHGGYICPFCGSGTGRHGTGGLHFYEDTNTWHCFACGKSGDVIDLHMNSCGVDHNTALADLSARLGITIDHKGQEPAAGGSLSKPDNANLTKPNTEKSNQQEKNLQEPATTKAPARDCTEYYKECRKRLYAEPCVKYIQSRGLSMATAANYGLGFDPKADPAGAGYPTPRLIIPTCKTHYFARRIDGGNTCKKMNNAGGTPGIFNVAALDADEPSKIFVTESATDALSIIEVGGEAIATNSANNVGKLIELLESKVKAGRPLKSVFILCFDNDKAGQTATNTLREELTRLNLVYVVEDICGGCKDPNEALVKDRASFLSAVKRAKERATQKPDNAALYIDQFLTADLERFKDSIETGYPNLDEQAGGLYPGLYVVAAISSLGKTTFCLQAAEQIAEGGKDVIFFSLEQSRLELVTKGIARRTAQNNLQNAVTSLQIRKGYLPAQVLKAADEYREKVGNRLSIVEGNFACNIGYIRDYTRDYINNNQVRPVVFVDYLQILQPTEENRASVKETVDKAVTELKRMSRELNIPVIVVSSVNRANYLTPVDFESLKESGGIEYTADVIYGLQLQCLNDDLFQQEKKLTEKRKKIKEAKAMNPRKIELVCLKNRYGIANFSCYFKYTPAYDLFEECGDYELDFVPEYNTPKGSVVL